MSKVITLLALLVFGASAHAQSLDATLGWIDDTIQDNSLVSSSTISEMTSFVHIANNSDRCAVEFLETMVYDPDRVEYRTLVFSLRDLDPHAVYVVDNVVLLPTTNGRKAVDCVDEIFAPRCKLLSGSEAAVLVSNRDYARRFARAMRHAITLCGGKPSTF